MHASRRLQVNRLLISCTTHYVTKHRRLFSACSRRSRVDKTGAEVYVKMSACGEFAEHVWKPGSCKNCFHPRSAHGQTGTAGGACVRTSLIGEDEDGVTSPSPYSKPTI
ncbi:hypothetical protein cypCar_00021833, partial [Cyprinus carpio]